MTDGSVAADIYMLIPHKDHETTPQSMLLHELGHCVNIALTGDPEIPPEDFALVMKLIGVDAVECDIPEFFAHCFARDYFKIKFNITQLFKKSIKVACLDQ